MGMFLKNTCPICWDECCEHTEAEKRQFKLDHPPGPPEPIIYSTTEPIVSRGDLICCWDGKKAVHTAFVAEISDGKPMVRFHDMEEAKAVDFATVEWTYGKYVKISSFFENQISI